MGPGVASCDVVPADRVVPGARCGVQGRLAMWKNLQKNPWKIWK